MPIQGTVPVGGSFAPTDGADSFGTHNDKWGVGGYRIVKTIADRDAIPVNESELLNLDDNLASGRRKLGMMVYVSDENKFYVLTIAQVTWDEYTESEKVTALADDTNFVEFSGGGVIPTLQQVLDEDNTATDTDILLNGTSKIQFENSSKVQKGTTDSGIGGNGGVALKCSIEYELKWEAGRLYIMQQDGIEIREVRYTLTVTPTVDDDIDKGFVVGSRWILDNNETWICTDNTDGAAVWIIEEISGGIKYGTTTYDAIETYTATVNGTVTSYEQGDSYLIKFDANNIGNTKIDINGVGEVRIYKDATTQLEADDIIADKIYLITYDGTYFQLVTLGGGGSSTGGGITHFTADGTDTYSVTGLTGVTAYNDADAYLVRFTNGNTTGCSLNINSLGTKTLYRNNDGPLIGGDILAGAEMLCIYNSITNGFQCIGTSPNTLLAYVTNNDTVTITKGQAVYISGAQGDRVTVQRAINTGDSTSAQTIGVVYSTSIGVNQKGIIITQGELDGLNLFPTATWDDGDPIYLDSTAGGLTKTKPYAPNHLVYLGYVITSSNGASGRMYVKVQNGYELEEIHDVDLITTTPVTGHYLYFNGTLWTNSASWQGNAIAVTKGGTGFASYAIGDLLYADTTTTLAKLNTVAAGSVLISGTTPSWSNSPEVRAILFDNATNSNIITLNTGATAANYTLTLPTAAPAANQYLQFSAAGVASWVNGTVTGVTTVGTFSASAQTNGATISGSTITFGPASATVPGMVSTGTQIWAGAKTFSSTVAVTATTNQFILSTAGAGTVTITTALNNTSRVATIPALAQASTFAFIEQSQSYSGNNTFSGTNNFTGSNTFASGNFLIKGGGSASATLSYGVTTTPTTFLFPSLGGTKTIATLDHSSQIFTGLNTFQGSLTVWSNATQSFSILGTGTGSAKLTYGATASPSTITIPTAGTDTFVVLALSQILTNKTLSTGTAIADGVNLTIGTTTGTTIGQAGSKLGFYGLATPIAKPTLATNDAAGIITVLRNLGLIV